MLYSLIYAALATTAWALDASVWTFDNTNGGPSISAENARLVLAHRLGLSRYHKLENADEHTLQLLSASQTPLFSEPATSRKLMLVIEGVAGELLDSAPSFTISKPPSTPFNEKLVSDLLLQDMHNRGGSRCGDKQFGGLVQGGISANMPAGLCMIGWEDKHKHTSLSSTEQLQILDNDAVGLSQFIYGKALPPSITSDYTAIFHVKSLEIAGKQHGVQSEQYKAIQSTLHQIISNIRSFSGFGQLTIVGMPFQERYNKRDNYGLYETPLQIREEQLLADTRVSSSGSRPLTASASNRTFPKTTISTCWSSKTACEANTASCSNHGQCIKKFTEKASNDELGPECWACACSSTVQTSASGQKTTYWGGPACQKKDISMPFFLFAGFTIAALATLSYGIGLLYSIGEEDLPSVLGAGVAPPSRK